jgi:hypothetical protein
MSYEIFRALFGLYEKARPTYELLLASVVDPKRFFSGSGSYFGLNFGSGTGFESGSGFGIVYENIFEMHLNIGKS